MIDKVCGTRKYIKQKIVVHKFLHKYKFFKRSLPLNNIKMPLKYSLI